MISQLIRWNNVLFRQIIGRSRRRSCWSTAWWRLLEMPAQSSMTTPAALASTWRWSSPAGEQWWERRYRSICWRNPESSTRPCKYHFFLFLSFSVFFPNARNHMTHECRFTMTFIEIQITSLVIFWKNIATKVIFLLTGQGSVRNISLPFTSTSSSQTGGICLLPALQSIHLFFLSCVWGEDQVKWRG